MILNSLNCSSDKSYIKNDSIDLENNVIVAILPFKNNSTNREYDAFSKNLADLISVKLSSSKRLKVVERQEINRIIEEITISQSGITEQNTVLEIGKMLGANIMGFGSFTTLGEKVILTLRLVKVETGEIIGGVNERNDNILNIDILAENTANKVLASIE